MEEWKKITKRKAYRRAYMRAYREKKLINSNLI